MNPMRFHPIRSLVAASLALCALQVDAQGRIFRCGNEYTNDPQVAKAKGCNVMEDCDAIEDCNMMEAWNGGLQWRLVMEGWHDQERVWAMLMPPVEVGIMAEVDDGMRGDFGSRPVDVVAEMPRVKRT